jgi:hypothetical protein
MHYPRLLHDLLYAVAADSLTERLLELHDYSVPLKGTLTSHYTVLLHTLHDDDLRSFIWHELGICSAFRQLSLSVLPNRTTRLATSWGNCWLI